jgi:hypothetical protein
MSIKERLANELNGLSDTELNQVEEYLAFLKFRSRIKPMAAFDKAQLAKACAEFADEDRQLAEEGMSDYAAGLVKEDGQ